jgi:hypothetical protein
MGLVATAIKTIAEAIPNTEYLQVSDTQKAEFELSKIALAGKTAILYNNLPNIPIDQNALNITENYPIEIWFLGLDSNFDDVDIETLLDSTKAIWAIFYNDLKIESFINLELSEGIELNAGAAYRIGAESFSGWQFLMTLSLESCPGQTAF